MTTYPTFKRGQRVYASRIPMGGSWTFDEPCLVTRVVKQEDIPYRDQPAYGVLFEDGGRLLMAQECLSDLAVSFPCLTWLEVLEARGLPRPAGFDAR